MSLWQRVLDSAVGVVSDVKDTLLPSAPAIPAGTNPIKARQIVNQAQQGDGGIDIGLGGKQSIGQQIQTPWGPATLYDPSDERYYMELDRLHASIDQDEHVLETQKTGRPIETRGVPRYAIGAFFRTASSRAKGATIGQHDRFKEVSERIQTGTLTDTMRSSEETKSKLQRRLGQRPSGQLTADPIISGLLGKPPTASL